MLSKSEKKLDPRVRRTRKLLKQAFIDLMHEKGFTAITVQDIADRAEINRATFYAHYTDKFELHDQMVLEWFRQHLAQYEVNAKSSFCGDNLRNLIFATCDFQVQLKNGCHPSDVEYKPAIEDLIQSEIYSIIYKWLRSIDGFDKADIAAATISWSIFGAGVLLSRNQKLSKEDIADTVIALIRDGLRSQVKHLPELAVTP